MPSKILLTGLLVSLAIFFMQKAVRPNAKRNWGWGRIGGEVPVSRIGYGIWGLTFLLIVCVLINEDKLSIVNIAVLGICLVAIIAVGFRDAWRFKKRKFDKK